MSKNSKKRVIKYLKLIYFLAFLTAISISCKEPNEGCLDADATNFDVSADVSCCCTYPAIRFSLLHRWDSILFSHDSIYNNGLASFRITDIDYYISGLELMDDSGVLFPSEDSIRYDIAIAGDTTMGWGTDDVDLVNRSLVDPNFGTSRLNGTISNISFDIGIDPRFENAVPSSFPTNHALYFKSDSMYLEHEGYLAAKFSYSLAPDFIDTIEVLIPFEDAVYDIDFQANTFTNRGNDHNFTFYIDYAEWFKNIDFQNNSPEDIKSTFLVNARQAFTFLP